MTEPDRDKMPASSWFWIIILVLLFITVIVWFVNPLGRVKGVAPATPVGQSTEWAPTAAGSSVPVTLPTTRMTNAPVQTDSSTGASSAAPH